MLNGYLARTIKIETGSLFNIQRTADGVYPYRNIPCSLLRESACKHGTDEQQQEDPFQYRLFVSNVHKLSDTA